MSGAPDLDALRDEMRRRRRRLEPAERERAEARILRHLHTDRRFRAADRVGLYWAVAGEVDLTPLLTALWARGCTPCLPRVSPLGRRMHFVAVRPDTTLRPDRYSIPSPLDGVRVPRASLDLLLVPLVAFDATGARVGMGAGYFDRYLAPLKHRTRPARPAVIGCGFACQEADVLPQRPWDVALDGVVTEDGLRWFRGDRTCATG